MSDSLGADEQPTRAAELTVVKLSLSPGDPHHPGIREWPTRAAHVTPVKLPLPASDSGYLDEPDADEQPSPFAEVTVVRVMLPPAFPGGEQASWL